MSTPDPLGRMDQIAACLRCIADLITPAQDLHTVDRQDFATAMCFLTSEYQIAREACERDARLAHASPMRVV